MTDDSINPAPDLTNPQVLQAKLLEAAGGLDQQATASRIGSAMGGHPFPEQFFRTTAHLIRAAAQQIADDNPVPKSKPAAEPEKLPTPPAPAGSGKK